MKCQSCSTTVPAASRFCPSCGAAIPSSTYEATLSFTPHEIPRADSPSTSPPQATSDISHGRFLPGAMLADRYRIVGLLGKGGMGEVYRADDLKLGTPVALKFLPKDVAQDPVRLEHFRSEVRLARQVSHPNVCRVFDIGEVDSEHFLSMEYVDGEDLAGLLRRIGRLPVDKGIQAARQICLGLAAAHEKGVLHRDLKPANIMLDGRGHVRITDFGLARQATEIAGNDVRSGTPAYMAPEQLAGEPVTVRSDLYSLGLVLYEILTGKMAFKAESFAELVRLHERSTPVNPATHVRDLDPSVEQVIMRCLARDPRKRPASAAAVAAALPGGDALAAALAAGETPSPEMVADAGDEGHVSPLGGAALLATVLLALVGAALLSHVKLVQRVPFDQSPQELAYTARRIVAELGHTEPVTDTCHGFSFDWAYLNYVRREDQSAERWDQLSTGQPAAIYFWYVQSPHFLVALPSGSVTPSNPPHDHAGMASVSLDLKGRLIEFRAVPETVERTGDSSQAVNWEKLFEEAGLEMNEFTAAEPLWTPPVYADERAAWEGSYPDAPHYGLRVEAAAHQGRPVYFRMIGPWITPPVRGHAHPASLNRYLFFMLPTVVLVGGGLMARRNWRQGRVDRRGAFRFVSYVFALRMLYWAITAQHVPSFLIELQLFIGALGSAVYWCGVLWVAYLAFEPPVRRRWPWRIIAWNRLLAGRFRDALVGKHLLIGAALGSVSGLIMLISYVVPTLLGLPPQTPSLTNLPTANIVAAGFLRSHIDGIQETLMLTVIFLLFVIIFRKEWLAVTALALVSFVYYAGRSLDYRYIEGFCVALITVMYISVFLRYGTLAIAAGFFFHWSIVSTPVSMDLPTWYAASAISFVVVLVGAAVYGFVTCVGNQPWMRGELFDA